MGQGWTAGADITDWQLTVAASARRVRRDLAGAAEDEQARAFAAAAGDELAIVAHALDGPWGWRAAVASWWSGWHIERAWRALHEAQVYAAVADAALSARLPSLRERARTQLGERDARLRALDALDPATAGTAPGRALVADALRAAFDASDAAHAGARALRNKLVGACVALLLLNGCVALTGLLTPSALPMCALTQLGDVPRPPVCVHGGAAPAATDVLIVQLLGGLGALLATVVLLTRRRPSLSPYVLTGYQALIKVTFGAALAVVGVFALGAGAAAGIACLRNQASLLAAAVLLGYGQQLGTRLLDDYAEKVLSAVRPLPDKA